MKAALKIIDLPDNASLKCRWRREPKFEFHWHYHPEYQLELLIRGKERLFVGDRVLDFEPGQLVLLGPNLPHSMLTENEVSRDNPEQESVIVQFPEASLGSDFLQRPEMRRIQKLLERSRRGLIYSTDHCRDIFDRVCFPSPKVRFRAAARPVVGPACPGRRGGRGAIGQRNVSTPPLRKPHRRSTSRSTSSANTSRSIWRKTSRNRKSRRCCISVRARSAGSSSGSPG